MTERKTAVADGSGKAEAQRAARAVSRLRRRARWVLTWERAAPRWWPLPTLAAAFLALALTDLLPRLPGWLHAGILAGFALAAAVLLVHALRGWSFPSAVEADRRIERDSAVPHRPLSVLAERRHDSDSAAAAGWGGLATALWRIHQTRMSALLGRLRVAPAPPVVAASDPLALRHLAILALLVVALGSRGDWGQRLWTALTPTVDFAMAAAPPATVDAWLTPPPSTGLAPIFLATGGAAGPAVADGRAVAVPAGSRLVVQVGGVGGRPTLNANGAESQFQAVDGQNYHAEAAVERGTRIAVTRRGRTLAEWPIEVVSDTAPTVAFTRPPAEAERHNLRLDYLAADDYGVAALRLRIGLQGRLAADGGRGTAVVDLPLGAVRPKQVKGGGLHDFTDHPWAGLPVTLTLEAQDTAGQLGESAPALLVLPQRDFSDPLARAIIAERRRLTLDGDAARLVVADALRRMRLEPKAYRDDAVVTLTLSAAASRLQRDTGGGAIAEVERLLWETALRIEDGGTSQSERALRDAQQALAQALERGAPEAELRQLMEQLQQAMDNWLDAVDQQMRQAMQEGRQPLVVPPELAQRMTDRSELQGMLDRLRSMTETGAREAARQMLSQMQQMLSRMQTAMPSADQMRKQAQAFDLVRKLRELTKREQELADETFRQMQQGPNATRDESAQTPGRRRPPPRNRPGANPPMSADAERQQGVRRSLGDVLREMGELGEEIPQPFARAERSMRDAEAALMAGMPGNALDAQTRAVDELQRGLDAFADQLMQQMGGGAMQQGEGGMGAGRDPLGRNGPNGMGMDTGDVAVPTQADAQRAREILDELRRRAGESARPRIERDYIDRLLQRF